MKQRVGANLIRLVLGQGVYTYRAQRVFNRISEEKPCKERGGQAEGERARASTKIGGKERTETCPPKAG